MPRKVSKFQEDEKRKRSDIPFSMKLSIHGCIDDMSWGVCYCEYIFRFCLHIN